MMNKPHGINNIMKRMRAHTHQRVSERADVVFDWQVNLLGLAAWWQMKGGFFFLQLKAHIEKEAVETRTLPNAWIQLQVHRAGQIYG